MMETLKTLADRIFDAVFLKAVVRWFDDGPLNKAVAICLVSLVLLAILISIVRWANDKLYHMRMAQGGKAEAQSKFYRMTGLVVVIMLIVACGLTYVSWQGIDAKIDVINKEQQKALNKNSNDSNEDDGEKGKSSDSSKYGAGANTALEAKIAAFKGQPDANGSYREAARQLVETAGATIDWSLDDIPNTCTGSLDVNTTVAVYCAVSPDTIYVNEVRPDYAQLASSPSFLDYIRHELAHREIRNACGVTNPKVVKGRTEAVANSYAVKYLGADASSFSKDTMGLKYAPDSESDKMAENVHAGVCEAAKPAQMTTK